MSINIRYDPEDCLTWPLAYYDKIIRGDETTSEDQVACAISPEMARRIVACVNACVNISTKDLEKYGELFMNIRSYEFKIIKGE